MKRIISLFVATVMAAALGACQKEESKISFKEATKDSQTTEICTKEPKNYTLVCIPLYYMDCDTSSSTNYPESLLENVTIDCQNENTVSNFCSLRGDVWKNANAASNRELTIDGKSYEYTLVASYANEWSASKLPSMLSYAYFDDYTCYVSEQSTPVSDMMINATTGKLSFFIRYIKDKSSQGDIGEKAIADRADQLLSEIYGVEYLECYTKTIHEEKYTNSKTYSVVYERDLGEYYCNEWVRFHFTAKGELFGINALYLDLFADYDFNAGNDQLLAAKEAMYSALYSKADDWKDRKPVLSVDGITGKYYLCDTVNLNDTDDEWEILLAIN